MLVISIFIPDEYSLSARDIDYEGLYAKGKRHLIFDLDNTIAPFDVPEPDAEVKGFFKRLLGIGFAVCLVSNNSEGRVRKFNESLGLKAVWRAGKPGAKAALKCMGEIGGTRDTSVFVGDQVFTDVVCGKRAGMHTILVKPVCSRDEFSVSLKRPFELPFLFYIKQKFGVK